MQTAPAVPTLCSAKTPSMAAGSPLISWSRVLSFNGRHRAYAEAEMKHLSRLLASQETYSDVNSSRSPGLRGTLQVRTPRVFAMFAVLGQRT